ncbi:MAG: ABC transporter permease [Acidobacteriia bacterium]|nr:ABC transporter permease [Terriglobia bacterium]
MSDPSRLYRLLLRLYPARFREEYAALLQLQFQDDYRGVRGRPALLAFWARVLCDLAVSIPTEIGHEVSQDVRTSARVYWRRPLATGLAVIALAMAIGVTTGVFSVLNGVLFRSLPFREPERLVQIWMFRFRGQGEVKDWGNHSAYLAEAAETSTLEVNLDRGAEAKRVTVTEVSSNFFQVLGVEPELGRAFAPDEDTRGPGVVVIGYGLWRDFWSGDRDVLGSTVRVNGVPLTVIGIAPRGFDYPSRTSMWAAVPKGLPRGYGVWDSDIVGRVKPGIPMPQAKAMFTTELRRVYPQRNIEFMMRNARFMPLRDELAGPVSRASAVLFAAVLLVLCIACANVAQLLLSRTNERRLEMSIRAALGASRSRLLQQLITEATVLTLLGTILGLPVAWWASALATRFEPAPLAAQSYVVLDWRVLAFMAAATVGTGVIFGLLPALTIRRMQPVDEIIRSQPGVAGSGPGKVRTSLVALQAALTVALLAGCIMMGRSFLKLLGADLGYQTTQVVTMRASVAGIYDKNRELQFYSAALERLRATPGVESAGAVRYLPLIDSDWRLLNTNMSSESGAMVSGHVVGNTVTSGYFGAMGIHFVAGRDFTAAEYAARDHVVIVDESFAQRSGLGTRIVGTRGYLGKVPYTIVGVVRDIWLGGPASKQNMLIYQPLEEKSAPGYLTFVARVRGRADAYLQACRTAVQGVDPRIPIYDAATLDQRLSGNLLRPRFYTTAILFLGVFAMVLAAIGIYGVASYSVTQRTHEIGVRIAIGAAPGKIRAAIVRQGMVPVIAGMCAGVAGAIVSGKFLTSLMSSSEPLRMQTCILGVLLLTLTALAAIWFATSRVIRIDPMAALKSE